MWGACFSLVASWGWFTVEGAAVESPGAERQDEAPAADAGQDAVSSIAGAGRVGSLGLWPPVYHICSFTSLSKFMVTDDVTPLTWECLLS